MARKEKETKANYALAFSFMSAKTLGPLLSPRGYSRRLAKHFTFHEYTSAHYVGHDCYCYDHEPFVLHIITIFPPKE